MSSGKDSAELYDVIGLGFGPANIAIAGAIVETWSKSMSSPGSPSHNRVLFIEKQPQFRWHPGMLLPNSRMQVSFLKDLATLRTPQSPITFLAYLHNQGRLLSFINRSSFTPTRKEYSDYLSWAAEYVQEHGVQVRYGEEVTEIARSDDGTVQVRSRLVLGGGEIFRRSKNLILSPGGTPKLPPALTVFWPHPHIIHTSSYITSADQLFESLALCPKPLRIAVIGAGQSSTEVLLDLHDRLNAIRIPGGRKHELDMIFRKGSLKPSDDTPFSNEIFDPASTDFMFGLPTKRDRQNVLQEYHSTNYSVVNVRTIDSLYEVMYHQRLLDDIKARSGREEESNRTRITLCPHTSIYSADIVPAHSANAETNEAVRLTLQGTLTRVVSQKTYDAVFCGTGYDRDSWMRLLASSNLADRYGIKSSNIELVPESETASETALGLFDGLEDMESPSSSTDGFSTPSTANTPHTTDYISVQPSKVRISRTYCLLPEREGKDSSGAACEARIFLQGCTQSTHGLSESLLSILGVRAGLLVDELFKDVA